MPQLLPHEKSGRVRRRGNGGDEFSGTRDAHSNACGITVRQKNIFSSEPRLEQPPRRNPGSDSASKIAPSSNWQRARQSHAAEYNRLFSQIPGVMPPLAPEGFEHVYHQYTIRVEQRDALQKFLSERKIGSAVYYPYPLHAQPLYASLGYKAGDFRMRSVPRKKYFRCRCIRN